MNRRWVTPHGVFESFEGAYADAWNRQWGARAAAQDARTPADEAAANARIKQAHDDVWDLRVAADREFGPGNWDVPEERGHDALVDWAISHAPQLGDGGRAR
jgi:hypothetical protein